MFWDFITLRPETTHQVSFLFSNRGTPNGYRHMNGYGSHTFKLVNKDGTAVYCKFHYKVREDLHSSISSEAETIFIEVTNLLKCNVVLGVVYRPPHKKWYSIF